MLGLAERPRSEEDADWRDRRLLGRHADEKSHLHCERFRRLLENEPALGCASCIRYWHTYMDPERAITSSYST